MPREEVNTGSGASTNPDGIREGVIKDPNGVQIGMNTDVNFGKAPLRSAKSKDEKLKKFEEMMKGTS